MIICNYQVLVIDRYTAVCIIYTSRPVRSFASDENYPAARGMMTCARHARARRPAWPDGAARRGDSSAGDDDVCPPRHARARRPAWPAAARRPRRSIAPAA